MPSTVGAQAEIWPCSVAKMKGAGPLMAFSVIEKSVVPLNTMPDGLPWLSVTTSDCARPVPSYSVDVPVPALAIHEKPCGLNARPQALTRLTSWCSALVAAVSLTSALAT